MSCPPVISLTDCADPNAVARQSARIAALFGATPSLLPLAGPDPEGAAALTLLDLLRSTGLTGGPTHPTVVLVNIAPRDGHWPNGAPFCWFRHGEHLVVSTLNPRVLAPLAAYLGLEEVQVTDVREVLEAAAAQWARLGPAEVEEIARTQFRSLWYAPLLARWLVDGRPVPAQPHAVQAPEPAEVRVAVVDNFGNCKLDRPAAALPGADGADGPGGADALPVRSRRDGRSVLVRRYDRLPDVPYGEPGITVGSSGIGFAELVVRGGSASALFGLREGDPVFRLTS
ncbi:SAM-dependent chlorinase/fluorinase [Streptacidiphilus sp. ASG 303]|uniref:SAM hydroxide adenosyltransferase n=1 Tax=Streptacidiphilus sp. ASG 303 TaxID=2896847 RepID=UPI001E4ABAC4|nr:SAM hydroxide adenosyltransferase [Streptacidiphilus sp. ASG 303]MCD0484250.1 SAM-dependent chlorinase/fluorinase [Streptacidiphilus sp. ASG 303]